MNKPAKDMRIEFKLFVLYGLRDVVTAAEHEKVKPADFVPLAETVLTQSQARAFAARWPTLTANERTQICDMLEQDHG
jgi:hypothetical protein